MWILTGDKLETAVNIAKTCTGGNGSFDFYDEKSKDVVIKIPNEL